MKMTPSNKNQAIIKNNPNIQKYDFKTIDEVQEIEHTKANEPELSNVQHFGKELVDTLLSKVDLLSGNLAQMQMQFEAQEKTLKEKLDLEKSQAHKNGFEEGVNETKNKLEQSTQNERQNLLKSIASIDEFLVKSQKTLSDLENDLGEIALKLAKEVIAKEVETSSGKIALNLAKSLISGIKEAVSITLKVNPEDYLFLKDNLNLEGVILESSDAISKGGVILNCALGEMHGDLHKRFELLKENMIND
ncbi:MAG: FliH/SctL family protein [Helicobacter sp.]|nr:FliH/SctL family protein [Helicobacter sp.]